MFIFYKYERLTDYIRHSGCGWHRGVLSWKRFNENKMTTTKSGPRWRALLDLSDGGGGGGGEGVLRLLPKVVHQLKLLHRVDTTPHFYT